MKNIYLLAFLLFGIKGYTQNCIPNTSSLTFNGTSSSVDLAAATELAVDSAITLEAWIKPTVFAANPWQNSIINKDGWTGTNGEGGFALRCGGNGILSFVFCGRTFASTTSLSWKEATSPAGTLVLNTWQHVAGTFNGSSLKIYVNGNLVGTTAFTGMIRFPNSYALKLGRSPETSSGQARYFNGSIDEVRVWERALSISELTANANSHINVAGQSRLIGYWRLNEGAGTITNNASNTTTANAALQGATWNTSVPFAGGLNMGSIIGAASINPLTPVNYYVTPSNLINYVWTITNGTIVSGQGNDSVTVVFAGTGQLSVIGNDTACADSSTKIVTAIPVGISKVQPNSKAILIAQSGNSMVFTNNTNTLQNITIYNTIGVIVANAQINANEVTELDSEVFAKGMYVYSCQSAQSKTCTGKFLIR